MMISKSIKCESCNWPKIVVRFFIRPGFSSETGEKTCPACGTTHLYKAYRDGRIQHLDSVPPNNPEEEND